MVWVMFGLVWAIPVCFVFHNIRHSCISSDLHTVLPKHHKQPGRTRLIRSAVVLVLNADRQLPPGVRGFRHATNRGVVWEKQPMATDSWIFLSPTVSDELRQDSVRYQNSEVAGSLSLVVVEVVSYW
jgi:hypothetical protein